MKTFLIAIGMVVLLLTGSLWWSRNMQSSNPDIISRGGIHWHPELEIFVNGEKIDIPDNVGLVGEHSPIHTHEDLPLIHLELGSVVRKDDIRLGKFFAVWRKDFMALGQSISMTVNGRENAELDNYVMHDGDKIVLRYSN
ncbi:MAG: hypothetical protein Q8Q92_01500 [bacterium]|nr:hypothetical protein [bacterium]